MVVLAQLYGLEDKGKGGVRKVGKNWMRDKGRKLGRGQEGREEEKREKGRSFL